VRPILQVPLLTVPGESLDRASDLSGFPARLRSPARPILQVVLLTMPGDALDHAGDLSGLQVAILIA
jgi:hypothetical protein